MKKFHGFTKSKAYGLCGAALASILLASETALADQVQATNTATNLSEIQNPSSKDKQDLTNQAQTQTGALHVTLSAPSLDDSSDLHIEEGAVRTYETLEKAKGDLKSQEQLLQQKKTELNQAKQEMNQIQAQNEQIKKENQIERERVEKLNQEEETRIQTENQLILDAVAKENQALLEEYRQQEKSYQAALAQRSKLLVEKIRLQNTLTKVQNELIPIDQLKRSTRGYTASGSTNHIEQQERLAGLRLLPTGSLKEPKVYVQGDISLSRIVTSFTWGNIAPQGAELMKGVYGAGNYWDAAYNYNQNGTTTQLWTGRIGNWYKIPQAIRTADGQVHDAYVQAEIDSSGLYKESEATKTDGTYFAMWNQDGAFNTLNGFTLGRINQESDGIRIRVRVDHPENEHAYLWVTVLHDLDLGQYLEVDKSRSQVLSLGGGLRFQGERVESDEELGFTYGMNRDNNALNGRTSSPDGSLLLAQYSKEYQSMIRNTPGGKGASVARADFGAAGRVEIHVVPEVPPIPFAPKKPDFKTPKLKIFVPYKPNFKTLSPLPTQPSLKVKVHPVQVLQQPKNRKEVINQSQIQIQGKLVPKGSKIIWTLQHQELQAGRPKMEFIRLRDPLPSGFQVDWAETEQRNLGAWNLSLENGGTLIFEATEKTLASVNQQLNQRVILPVAYLVGSPQNDGGTYENTFETVMMTPIGSYRTVSNTPVIYTPGQDPNHPRTTPDGSHPTPHDNWIQPKKEVLNPQTGQSLQGQSILPGQRVHYRLTQDFDQYKGILTADTDLSTGFHLVDDYPDQAVDPDSIQVHSIRTAQGKEVQSLLEMRHVLSTETLSTGIQELFKNAEVRPNGGYFLWSAKDPRTFFKDYVQTGSSLTYHLSFSLKKNGEVDEVRNQAYQVDFGNGYATNPVVNKVSKPRVVKEVLDGEAGQSLHQQEVALGQEVSYHLEGWTIPGDRSYLIQEYRFFDDLAEGQDAYRGDRVLAKVDLHLKDGRILPKGSDLSAFADRFYDENTGFYQLAFKTDFLEQLSEEKTFGADVFLMVERVAPGRVQNTFQLMVNGWQVQSQTVETWTPDPVEPIDPKEHPEESAHEEKSVKKLPKTASQESELSFIGNLVLGLAAFIVAMKNRKP